jgi:ABC-type bacteriocin/lantibiotic exporter with double-glycine peptidase domain
MEMFKLLMSSSKKTFTKSVAFVALITGMQVFLPLSVRWMISRVEEMQSYQMLAVFLIGYAVLLLMNNLLNVGWTYTLDELGGEVLQEIRMNLYKSLYSARYEEILKIGKEKIKHILYMDTLNIYSSLSVHAMQVMSNTFLIIVFLLVSAWINPLLSLILLIASIIGFMISMLSRKSISDASMKVNLQMKADNKLTNEYVDAIELAKTNALVTYFQKKENDGLWKFIHTAMKADKVLVFLKKVITDFHQWVSVGVSAFLAISMYGKVSAGDLVYYIFVSEIVLNTSQSIESSIYTMIHMMPSFENVKHILDLSEPDGEKEIEKIEGISFDDVAFSYQEGTPIFNHFSAHFQQGDIIRVEGENGSGKSTFVKLLIGLLHPSQGTVRINGIPIEEIAPDKLWDQIVYIDQDEIILNDSVKEYLQTMAGRKLGQDEIQQLKQKVHFDEDIEDITENGKSLSGGQRKKLLLMKLLLRYERASVMILDEIEAGLDLESKKLVRQIEEEILKQKKDAIVFKITHEENGGIYNKTLHLTSE